MATDLSFIEYILEQLQGIGDLRYRKMFGEYMVYVNDKPVMTVCDNTIFVKQHDCIAEPMQNAKTGHPYDGAKLHYILDIDDTEFAKSILLQLEAVTPLPKKRQPKSA